MRPPGLTMESLLTAMPVTLYETQVNDDWVDFNGHMNVAYYAILFDHALDAFLDIVDLGHAYTRREGGFCSWWKAISPTRKKCSRAIR